MELDSKCEGGAGNTGIKLELMWLPILGDDKRCHLIAGVIREPGSCFLFRKKRS